jgi:hypothetical protein
MGHPGLLGHPGPMMGRPGLLGHPGPMMGRPGLLGHPGPMMGRPELVGRSGPRPAGRASPSPTPAPLWPMRPTAPCGRFELCLSLFFALLPLSLANPLRWHRILFGPVAFPASGRRAVAYPGLDRDLVEFAFGAGKRSRCLHVYHACCVINGIDTSSRDIGDPVRRVTN